VKLVTYPRLMLRLRMVELYLLYITKLWCVMKHWEKSILPPIYTWARTFKNKSVIFRGLID
jgi:hypothetical protein